MTMKQAIGEAFRAAREEILLTRGEAAEAMGMTYHQIRRLENGLWAKDEVIERVLAYYNKRPHDILYAAQTIMKKAAWEKYQEKIKKKSENKQKGCE